MSPLSLRAAGSCVAFVRHTAPWSPAAFALSWSVLIGTWMAEGLGRSPLVARVALPAAFLALWSLFLSIFHRVFLPVRPPGPYDSSWGSGELKACKCLISQPSPHPRKKNSSLLKMSHMCLVLYLERHWDGVKWIIMKVTHQRQFFVLFIEGSLLGNVFPHTMVCKFSNQMHANHIQQIVVLVLKGGRGMTYIDPPSGCSQLESLPVVWALRIPTGKKQLASTFIWVYMELLHSARWIRTHTWLIRGPWACV